MGIDPGYKGAIGILSGRGRFIAVYDMPIEIINKKGTKIVNFKRVSEFSQEVDGLKLSEILLQYPNAKAIIEKVSSMPDQGVASSFNFGTSYGIAIGCVRGNRFELSKVPPNKWKAYFNLSSDKILSLELARELFPEAKEFLKLKKHDGRAEALLLAEYLRRTSKNP